MIFACVSVHRANSWCFLIAILLFSSSCWFSVAFGVWGGLETEVMAGHGNYSSWPHIPVSRCHVHLYAWISCASGGLDIRTMWQQWPSDDPIPRMWCFLHMWKVVRVDSRRVLRWLSSSGHIADPSWASNAWENKKWLVTCERWHACQLMQTAVVIFKIKIFQSYGIIIFSSDGLNCALLAIKQPQICSNMYIRLLLSTITDWFYILDLCNELGPWISINIHIFIKYNFFLPCHCVVFSSSLLSW